MIHLTVSGVVARDARLVRVKDRDYISIVVNAARPKDEAVWVGIMYYAKDPVKLRSFLVKGAKVIATGTRYADKVYEGTAGAAIDRTLWADNLDIVHFVETDDIP